MSGEANTDIFVIGGGVNGCGIARDAAGRGLTVTLAEADDLASGTSSASTKTTTRNSSWTLVTMSMCPSATRTLRCDPTVV